MKHTIHTIPVKVTNCYLIREDDGWVLVDSGIPGDSYALPATSA